MTACGTSSSRAGLARRRPPERAPARRAAAAAYPARPLREAFKVLADRRPGRVAAQPRRHRARSWTRCGSSRDRCAVMGALEALGSGELACRRTRTDAQLIEIRALHYEMLAYHASAAIFARPTSSSTGVHLTDAREPGRDRDLRRPRPRHRRSVRSTTPRRASSGEPPRTRARARSASRACRSSSSAAASARRARKRSEALLDAMHQARKRARERLPGSSRQPRRGRHVRARARACGARSRARCCSTRACRGRYSTDASIYQIEPVGVVVPRTTEDDARARSQIAAEAGVPVLPRGAGTSQCGQTVGAALVIDNSKYLNRIARVRSATRAPSRVAARHRARPAERVPAAARPVVSGRRLDQRAGDARRHGRQQLLRLALDPLRQHGAQRARRSTRVLADGPSIAFGASDEIAARPGRLPRAGGEGARDRPRARPRRSRRAGRRCCAACRATTSTWSLPAAARTTWRTCWSARKARSRTSQRLHLKLSPLPKHKTLGVCHFPTFYQAMEAPQHIVKLEPAAVELVDRTMIELARGNAAFRADRRPLRHGRARTRSCWSSSPATTATTQLAKLEAAGRADGRSRPAGQRGRGHRRRRCRSDVWEVRKAGLNIMMSMKGDGKPVSFIEDCAVPLEHLAEYTDRLTQVFEKHGTRGTWYAHASVGTLHVRPVLNMTARRRAARCAPSPRKPARWCASTRAPTPASTATAWCARSGSSRSSARGSRARSAEIKDLFDPKGLMNPGKIVRAVEDGRPLAVPLQARLRRRSALDTALDWSEWTPERRRLRRPRSRCATTTATAASSTPARCARRSASPATSST